MHTPPVVRRIGVSVSRASAWIGQAYRVAVTTGRWAVVAGWVALAALITVFAPAGGAGGGSFGDLLPADHPVIRIQERILEEFRVPVLSGTTVVLHQPDGLSLLTRADSVLWALATTQRNVEDGVPPEPGQIIAAIPVPTGVADTTATYLYVSDGTGLHNTVRLAEEYAAHFDNQPAASTYVTGFVPATVAQIHYLSSYLGLFEAASGLLILLVVAVAFRSVLAPLVVLGIAAVGYVVYRPLLAVVAGAFGFEVPSQLEPVLLALLLGLVTDYCVLFFSALRDELDAGSNSREGVRHAVRRDSPIIAVAGLCVAGGTISLLAAPFGIFRGLGPALALTVLVSLAVCLTLVPAVMTILGWRLFTVLPVRGSKSRRGRPAPEGSRPAELKRRAGRGIELLSTRGPALAATLGVVVVLGVAAIPLAQARLDLSATVGLPSDDVVAQGAQLLGDAGVRGISAPTEIFLEQDGVTGLRASLTRLEDLIARQPGVVRVLGPADSPVDDDGVVLAESGNAARFVVVYNSDPLAAEAISNVRHLLSELPTLALQSGFPDAQISVTGQTVIASEVAQLTRESLEVTLLVALVVELVILALYLRALVAPAVLLACSVLSVAAALGLTTLVFQVILGEQGLTFYAPFAAAVLLIALGSDYNVFAVGAIWQEAGRRPLAEALKVAVPRTSRAITTAGVILAGTFALVAIIPLSTFRQIAFAMTVGMLIDTLVVRPVLTPAVLTLLGPAASWPSHRITTGSPSITETAEYPMTDGTRSPTRRRPGRTAQQAFALAAGILVVLGVVDALARAGAESLVARQVESVAGVTARPEVQIRGTLFLPQLIRGAYDEVDVTTVGVTSGELRVQRVESQLFDVRVPFHDVLVRDVNRVAVARSDERVFLRYEDLNAYLDATDRPLRLASAPDGQVKITGSVNLAGQPAEVSANATLSVEDGELRVTPRQIDTGTDTLDEASRLLLGERLKLAVPLADLPFEHQLTGATPDPDGIRIEAHGTAIYLQP